MAWEALLLKHSLGRVKQLFDGLCSYDYTVSSTQVWSSGAPSVDCSTIPGMHGDSISLLWPCVWVLRIFFFFAWHLIDFQLPWSRGWVKKVISHSKQHGLTHQFLMLVSGFLQPIQLFLCFYLFLYQTPAQSQCWPPSTLKRKRWWIFRKEIAALCNSLPEDTAEVGSPHGFLGRPNLEERSNRRWINRQNITGSGNSWCWERLEARRVLSWRYGVCWMWSYSLFFLIVLTTEEVLS